MESPYTADGLREVDLKIPAKTPHWGWSVERVVEWEVVDP
jgi:hypothetical protein